MLPRITEPTGADKPFDKQHETESQSFVNSSTDLFSAIAALNILAPSKCMGILFFFAKFFTSLKKSVLIGDP